MTEIGTVTQLGQSIFLGDMPTIPRGTWPQHLQIFWDHQGTNYAG